MINVYARTTFKFSDDRFQNGSTSNARPPASNLEGGDLLHPGHQPGREGGGQVHPSADGYFSHLQYFQVQSFLLAAISPYLASLLSQVDFPPAPLLLFWQKEASHAVCSLFDLI